MDSGQIVDYVLGLLDDAQLAAAEREISLDPDLAERVRATARYLDKLLGGRETIALPPELQRRLRQLARP